MNPLEPDRDALEIFVDAVLRHRGTEGFIAVRAFHEDRNEKEAALKLPVSLKGSFGFLVDCVEDYARRAAQFPEPLVFCPPTCVFNNAKYAREENVLAGLVLSVECDRTPHDARRQLEDLLGPATIVVRSGGIWIDEDGEVHDELHLHWRLAQPACSKEELAALRGARESATRLVDADGTNNPICHPIRWPGSWHRKKEPRLCSIVTAEPDVEIKLVEAIAALPPPPAVTQQALPPEVFRTFIDQAHEGSDRSRSIARLYGYLVRHYVDPFVALSIAYIFDETRNEPPLNHSEVRRICSDIANKEADRREGRR